MRFASAVSRTVETDRAVAEVIAEVKQGLGDQQPDLVLVFVTRHHQARLGGLPIEVGEAFDGALVIGCTAAGVVGAGSEVEGGPGLSLTAAILPGVALHPFHISNGGLPEHASDVEAWRRALPLDEDELQGFVLLSDPLTFDMERLLPGLDATWPDAPKIGGLASGGQEPGEHLLFLGPSVHAVGAVGVAFSGDLVLDTLVAQGCRPVGPPMIITACDGKRIVSLDGQTPSVLLREVITSLETHELRLAKRALLGGIEMRDATEYQAGDFLVRNLVGFESDTGALVIDAYPRLYQVLQLHVRDAEAASQDVYSVLESGREQTPVALSGALMFTCLGRGRGLYGQADHDTDAFRAQFGDTALAGFFCNGEIGPVQGTSFLHGYTSTFGLFRPRSGEP